MPKVFKYELKSIVDLNTLTKDMNIPFEMDFEIDWIKSHFVHANHVYGKVNLLYYILMHASHVESCIG